MHPDYSSVLLSSSIFNCSSHFEIHKRCINRIIGERLRYSKISAVWQRIYLVHLHRWLTWSCHCLDLNTDDDWLDSLKLDDGLRRLWDVFGFLFNGLAAFDQLSLVMKLWKPKYSSSILGDAIIVLWKGQPGRRVEIREAFSENLKKNLENSQFFQIKFLNCPNWTNLEYFIIYFTRLVFTTASSDNSSSFSSFHIFLFVSPSPWLRCDIFFFSLHCALCRTYCFHAVDGAFDHNQHLVLCYCHCQRIESPCRKKTHKKRRKEKQKIKSEKECKIIASLLLFALAVLPLLYAGALHCWFPHFSCNIVFVFVFYSILLRFLCLFHHHNFMARINQN